MGRIGPFKVAASRVEITLGEEKGIRPMGFPLGPGTHVEGNAANAAFRIPEAFIAIALFDWKAGVIPKNPLSRESFRAVNFLCFIVV